MPLAELTLSDPRLDACLEGRSVPFFCSPAWNRVLEEGLGAKAAYYALERDGRWAAALAGVHLRFGPVRLFYANLPYGGLVGDPAAFGALVAALREALRRRRVHEVRIVRTAFDAFDAPPGYEVTEAVHHLLDLGGLDFSAGRPYPSAVMRNVRKAHKAGVAVAPVADAAEMDALYDLYAETMKRHGEPTTWTRRFLRALHAQLAAPGGPAEVLGARHEGRLVAGLVLVRSGDVVHYFFGASDPEAFALRPNDALFYEAIRRSAEAGARTFDFMTSRPTDAGLIRFKEKWGGKPRPLRIYRDELSPLHARLWRLTQRAAGSRLGAALARWLQKHR